MLFSVYLIAIYLFGFYIQSRLLLNWDVSWLMHASQRMLAGGSYTNDFFEINPPLILYLYVPPVLLHKITNISIVCSLQLYVYSIATISLFVCSKLASKVFYNQVELKNIVIITLAAIFMLLPIYQFGQREHLLLMLTFPYLFLVIYRLKIGEFSKYSACIIGIFAGLGFGIKPYFLLIPLLIELYVVYRKKNIFYFIREETLSLALVMALYLTLIYCRHLDYLTIVMPIFKILYYSGFESSWNMLLLNPLTIFAMTSLVLIVVFFTTTQESDFFAVITISAVAYLIIYLIQKTTLYYHLMPMLASIVLLISTSYRELFARIGKVNNNSSGELSILSFFGFTLTVYVVNSQINYLFRYVWPAYIIILAVALFYVSFSKKFIHNRIQQVVIIVFSIACILGVVIFTQSILLNDFTINLSTNMLMLAMVMLVGLALVVKRLKYALVMYLVFGGAVFSWPVCSLYNSYLESKMLRADKLIDFLKPLAENQSIYIFSSSTTNLFPAVDYIHAIPATRFAFMGWIPMAVKHPSPEVNAAVNFLNQALLTDLNAQMPKYILIDDTKIKPHLGQASFNYLTYFANDSQFQKLWKHYHYVTTFESLPFYKLKVYEKN